MGRDRMLVLHSQSCLSIFRVSSEVSVAVFVQIPTPDQYLNVVGKSACPYHLGRFGNTSLRS